MKYFDKYERFNFLDPREIKLHKSLRKYYQNFTQTRKKVSIIVSTNKEIYMENIFTNFVQQNYPNKELIIILNNNKHKLQNWIDFSVQLQLMNVQIYQLDEDATLGECLNYAIGKSTGKYIAKFDDDDFYAPNYLVDMVPAFTYTDAFIVGKASQFIYFESDQKLMLCHPGMTYCYTKNFSGGALVIKRELFDNIKFRLLNRGEDDNLINDCISIGRKHYSVDPFNYMVFRRINKDFHTWKIDDSKYQSWGTIFQNINNPREFVTI